MVYLRKQRRKGSGDGGQGRSRPASLGMRRAHARCTATRLYKMIEAKLQMRLQRKGEPNRQAPDDGVNWRATLLLDGARNGAQNAASHSSPPAALSRRPPDSIPTRRIAL